MVKITSLCALALSGLINLEGPVVAGSTAQFRCTGNLPGSLDRIAVFGNYKADSSGGDYGLVGPLDVAALDGTLQDVDGERHIANWATRLGSHDEAGGACSHQTAERNKASGHPCQFKAVISDGRGSSITMIKSEGRDRATTIDVNLKAGYGMAAYVRTFPDALCTFKMK